MRRVHLTAGRTAADTGDLKVAMAAVALAFDRLIVDWGQRQVRARITVPH